MPFPAPFSYRCCPRYISAVVEPCYVKGFRPAQVGRAGVKSHLVLFWACSLRKAGERLLRARRCFRHSARLCWATSDWPASSCKQRSY